MGQLVCRVGDLALCPADVHSCPLCPHIVTGPATSGSPDTLVNGIPVLRIGDPGVHAACCGPNTWNTAQGSSGVLVNDIPVVRLGDMTEHCGGAGVMITASGDVIIGGDASMDMQIYAWQDTPGVEHIVVPIPPSVNPETPPAQPDPEGSSSSVTTINVVAAVNVAAVVNVEAVGAVTTALAAAEAVAVVVVVLV